MAEARTMEEGLKAYQDGKFSRQSLFELVVARIKATEANLVRLEEQYRVMVSAMVRGAQDKPPSPLLTTTSDGYMAEYTSVEHLRAEAEGLGVKTDKRWSASTLMDKIIAARNAPNGAGVSNG